MKNILFLNHKQKQCGVFQYGKRSSDILKNSKLYNFIYSEVENEHQLNHLITAFAPHGIIYNYHPSTMPWINNQVLNKYKDTFHFGIHHEGNDIMNVWFDYYLMSDSTFKDIHNKYSIPRPLFENENISYQGYNIPTIGSFGFGFNNKGFEKLVKTVNDEFNIAQIRLHIPFAYYGDMNGNMAKEIADRCNVLVTKTNISLTITHNFFTDYQLLHFLASNWINCFFYDNMPGRGLASVIDYAISVSNKIAVTDSHMFRHITKDNPDICIENNSLKNIIETQDTDKFERYQIEWSNENFIKKYESIIQKTERLV